MADEVTAVTDVPLTCEEAFALYSSGLGSWWPLEFSWSQDRLEEIGRPYALERFGAAAA